MSHTPGPWAAHRQFANRFQIVPAHRNTDPTNREVACIAHVIGATPYWEDLEANAHLIAVAPDMLAALEEIAKAEGAFSRDPLQHASNVIENMQRIAMAAIAKAKVQETQNAPDQR